MLVFLKGIVQAKVSTWIILEAHDIGYKVFLSSSLLLRIKEGETVTLYTHHHIKEDSDDLYGFTSLEQLLLFELLLNVSGIGPKTALQIIDLASVEAIYQAILAENLAFIASAKGIGNKTAAKIIIELKNKITKEDLVAIPSSEGGADLLAALQSLGYSLRQIKPILGSIDTQQSLEKQVKRALQMLGSSTS